MWEKPYIKPVVPLGFTQLLMSKCVYVCMYEWVSLPSIIHLLSFTLTLSLFFNGLDTDKKSHSVETTRALSEVT